ncbi:hypothetical protein B0T17DRAFT_589241 [Bombardia bombarda]|uniref:Uncharacterized protein n=1 Tax=Bombardia bombarda TaxID=252184 RepID=A0AA39X8Y0_9PEZI|nr:hypothetical protein B0T17DRAFT_589241 [Bombardia bombarda]
MSDLVLAPYDESMRLGQGYNSFLQIPCVPNAVHLGPDDIIVNTVAKGTDGISKLVSYSSHFVDKISDVANRLNISPASSIKTGFVDILRNSRGSGVDEAEFASSDFNAVISVKVITETTTLAEGASFQPPRGGARIDDAEFLNLYGDCYISGFINGGDLHGIISMKTPDSSTAQQVEEIARKQLDLGDWVEKFRLSKIIETASLDALQSQMPADDFPERVTSSPQRTWAVLTRYDSNQDFVRWAEEHSISVPNYRSVQPYACELLNMYMGYKRNLVRVQAVLSDRESFSTSLVAGAVGLDIKSLLVARKAMKNEMALIAEEMDRLCLRPHEIEQVKSQSRIQSPNAWASRLPVPGVSEVAA